MPFFIAICVALAFASPVLAAVVFLAGLWGYTVSVKSEASDQSAAEARRSRRQNLERLAFDWAKTQPHHFDDSFFKDYWHPSYRTIGKAVIIEMYCKEHGLNEVCFW